MSTRIIGAMVMVHGDDKGLVIPPKVAPVQVVIVPIPFKDAEPAVIVAKAKEIAETLRANGFSVVLDDREEYTPGWKFNQWELKGVPIRIEIGPRDIRKGEVVMVRRDSGLKKPVKEGDVSAAAERLLQEIQDDLFAKAKALLQEKTSTVQSYEEFKKVVCDKGGFLKAAWCGSADCEAKIKDETGATIRVRPFQKEEPTTNCIYCGRKATEMVYFARAY
jgi:prolyl-tRNA synthetase